MDSDSELLLDLANGKYVPNSSLVLLLISNLTNEQKD